MANVNGRVTGQVRDQEGFRAVRARIGHELGTQRLGVSLWEVEPGQAAYPYHFHLGEEELLVVLAGSPLLRTPLGERRVEPGEVLCFLRGERGAHQLVNDSDEPLRFLAVSTNGEPDLVLYPDSGKVGAAERQPDGGGFLGFFRLGDAVDYYEGESR
jgi:uncharacterized cupin superfamily protein